MEACVFHPLPVALPSSVAPRRNLAGPFDVTVRCSLLRSSKLNAAALPRRASSRNSSQRHDGRVSRRSPLVAVRAERAATAGVQDGPRVAVVEKASEARGCEICVSITADTVEGAREAMKKAKEAGATMAELRLDLLTSFDPTVDLPALLADRCLPVIVTYRPEWEGGKYTGEEEARQAVLLAAMEQGAEYIDVELKVASPFIQKYVQPRREAGQAVSKVIVSQHDYVGTPGLEELRAVLAAMLAAGADVAKVATTANDICDNAVLFQLLSEAEIPTIALAMGPRGVISRILAPKYCAFLTFASLAKGAESAAGQVPVEELVGLYKLGRVGPLTKVLGVVANPVGHSKSPSIHNAALQHAGEDAVYVPLLVDDVARFFDTFNLPDFVGYSVTIPHKIAALAVCDAVEPLAKGIGAVNTVLRRDAQGQHAAYYESYNTDCLAAVDAIEAGLRALPGEPAVAEGGSALAGRLVVVLGSGGLGRALAYGAKARGAEVLISNIIIEEAQQLAAEVGATALLLPPVSEGEEAEGGGSDQLLAAIRRLQAGRHLRPVLANATPVGMYPDVNGIPVSRAVVREMCLVFDGVYVPRVTRLLREAEEEGVATVDGVTLFVDQAAQQFELFTGKPATMVKDLMRDVVVAAL